MAKSSDKDALDARITSKKEELTKQIRSETTLWLMELELDRALAISEQLAPIDPRKTIALADEMYRRVGSARPVCRAAAKPTGVDHCAAAMKRADEALALLQQLMLLLTVPDLNFEKTNEVIAELKASFHKYDSQLEKRREEIGVQMGVLAWLKDSNAYTWSDTFQLPLKLHQHVAVLDYEGKPADPEKVDAGERVSLFVQGAPAGQRLTIKRNLKSANTNAENFGAVAKVAIGVLTGGLGELVTAASFTKNKDVLAGLKVDKLPTKEVGPPQRKDIQLGTESVGSLRKVALAYLDARGPSKGKKAELSVYDFDCPEGKDACANDKRKKGNEPVAEATFTTTHIWWEGFTFLIDGAFNFAPDKHLSDPSYKKDGSPSGGQQLYQLSYADPNVSPTLSLLLGARFKFGKYANLFLGTGPALQPSRKKMDLQWNITGGWSPWGNIYLTAGVGFRRSKMLEHGSDLGQTISVPVGTNPPAFDDTKNKFGAIGMVGISLDLALLMDAGESVVKGLSGDKE